MLLVKKIEFKNKIFILVTKSKNKARKITMFCSICANSNPSNKHTHNVRYPNGEVCCPILKNTVCHICKKTGHISKFCKMKESNTLKTTNFKPLKTEIEKPKVKSVAFTEDTKKPLKKNIFSVLADEDDFDKNTEKENNSDMFPFGEIIWGVGSSSMIGKRWADECGA